MPTPRAGGETEQRGAYYGGPKGRQNAVGLMLSESQIRNVIADTVRVELAPCNVRVSVQERDDSDDDGRVFIVTVSMQTERAPDRRKMLGLTRSIQSKLNEAEVRDSFPMLSFIAESEERQSGLEFA